MEAQMNLYDYAKNLVKKEVPMDAMTANRKHLEMAHFILDNEYTMLLNRERADYTVFDCRGGQKKEPLAVAADVRETLMNRGILLLADEQKDGSYEIWIRDPETEENFVYYLFNAGEMIIKETV